LRPRDDPALHCTSPKLTSAEAINGTPFRVTPGSQMIVAMGWRTKRILRGAAWFLCEAAASLHEDER
jgi:hypothetical protein